MSFANSSDRLPYDQCAYQQQYNTLNQIYDYQFFLPGKENCKKCVSDKFLFKQDPRLVNVESELRGQTRPQSKCNRFKFEKDCKKSKICTSTFDNSNPSVLDPSNCTIIRHNYPRFEHINIPKPSLNCCPKKQFQQKK